MDYPGARRERSGAFGVSRNSHDIPYYKGSRSELLRISQPSNSFGCHHPKRVKRWDFRSRDDDFSCECRSRHSGISPATNGVLELFFNELSPLDPASHSHAFGWWEGLVLRMNTVELIAHYGGPLDLRPSSFLWNSQGILKILRAFFNLLQWGFHQTWCWHNGWYLSLGQPVISKQLSLWSRVEQRKLILAKTHLVRPPSTEDELVYLSNHSMASIWLKGI